MICCKDIESKVVGESTLNPRVSWLSDSFDSAKETLSALSKVSEGQETLGTRLTGDCVIEELCLVFLEYSKKIFKATWLTCKTNKTTM